MQSIQTHSFAKKFHSGLLGSRAYVFVFYAATSHFFHSGSFIERKFWLVNLNQSYWIS